MCGFCVNDTWKPEKFNHEMTGKDKTRTHKLRNNNIKNVRILYYNQES